jgi:hypothetical protein
VCGITMMTVITELCKSSKKSSLGYHLVDLHNATLCENENASDTAIESTNDVERGGKIAVHARWVGWRMQMCTVHEPHYHANCAAQLKMLNVQPQKPEETFTESLIIITQLRVIVCAAARHTHACTCTQCERDTFYARGLADACDAMAFKLLYSCVLSRLWQMSIF